MNSNQIPPHINWLKDTGERIITSEGKEVLVFELQHKEDEAILSAWAKHFRNHYCLDSLIDSLRSGTGLSRSEYLNRIKFPDQISAPGPSIRSGDFGEILIADYLEYLLNYWVPRNRYDDKVIRNESTRGSDILGFKFIKEGEDNPQDELIIFESKSRLSKPNTSGLQDAVDDSGKDQLRKAFSLNAIKQRFLFTNNIVSAKKVERFQNPIYSPYKEISGAVALFSSTSYDKMTIAKTSTKNHPNNGRLILMVIKGNNMMNLVNNLYKRAANEA